MKNFIILTLVLISSNIFSQFWGTDYVSIVEEGEFDESWPEGFFNDREKDLF